MTLATIEPRPNLVAGHRPHAIVPQTFDEVWRLAAAVVKAGMAPNGMDTPEKATIAICRGLELGLTPLMALDKIAVVNGRACLWGDGVIGLVRASGLCEYVKEWIEGTGDNRIAHCETRRKGEPEPVRRSFSVADAKNARLWGKQGPWSQFPERMLAMRARAFCLRDTYADCLGGLYIKEELDGVIDANARDVTPTPPVPPSPPPVAVLTVAADSATRKQLEASVAQIEAEKSGFDFEAYRAALEFVESNAEADAVWRQFVENANVITEEETEEAQRILNEATARFWKEEP